MSAGKQRYHYRLFGGDAARQRAEEYAEHIDGSVYRLIDEISPLRWGLDCFARDPSTGVVFSHIAVRWHNG